MSRVASAKPVTLRQVAELAGVGYSTAGLIMSGRGDQVGVKAETQQRVLEAAKELDYEPNHLARGLRGQGTRSIGLIWSLCGPHDAMGTVQYLAREAQMRGYFAHIAESFSELETVQSILADFVRRRVDGVIFQVPRAGPDATPGPNGHSPLNDQTLPTPLIRLLESFKAVTLISEEPFETPFDSVFSRYDTAYDQAMARLMERGVRRFAFVSIDVQSDYSKFAALRETLRRHGASDESLCVVDWVFPVDAEVQEALACAESQGVLAALGAVDVIFCGNDNHAAMLIQCLARIGRRVPEDVAVIGYNDQVMSRCVQPPLASVSRSDRQVVEAAAQLLFSRIEGGGGGRQVRYVDPVFVPRASAGVV